MLRRLLIAFLLLLVVAVVAVDRIGEHVAAHVLAGKLESDEHLSSRPSVSISGIPFLTQAFGGDYHEVSVTAHNVDIVGDVRVTTLKVHLHGVHIPFSKVIGGSVKRVPVDRADGTAFMSFAEISRYLSGQGPSITVSRSSPHALSVVGRFAVGGRPRLIRAVVTIGVSGSVVTLTPTGGISGAVSATRLGLPLRGLPFRLTFTSATVSSAGIVAAGTAHHVVLGS